MQITCKCLNVSIDTQGSIARDVDVSCLDLTATDKNDAFFKEPLLFVEHGRISKVQSSLVRCRNVGLWIIHSCLNCTLNTHAIHREKGAAIVLFTKALLTNADEITSLKNSENYSPVFRIIVFKTEPHEPSLQVPTKFAVSQFPPAVQTALSALQQQLSDVIQQETARTEERVRQYSEQQYAALEEFRERSHYDHRLLAKLLCEAQEKFAASEVAQPASLDNLETPPSTPDNHNVPTPLASSMRPVKSPASVISPTNYVSSPSNAHGYGDGASNFASPGGFKQNRLTNSPLSTPSSRGKPERVAPSRLFGNSKNLKQRGSSFDAEGLFDLEGMDEQPTEASHFEEDSDTDDSGSHDEGIHIPRTRGIHNLAKSLPVNVPLYMPQDKRTMMDPDEDQLPHPMDIAASIKALAKSVHGDANVFGDLPRPRFSTQI